MGERSEEGRKGEAVLVCADRMRKEGFRDLGVTEIRILQEEELRRCVGVVKRV